MRSWCHSYFTVLSTSVSDDLELLPGVLCAILLAPHSVDLFSSPYGRVVLWPWQPSRIHVGDQGVGWPWRTSQKLCVSVRVPSCGEAAWILHWSQCTTQVSNLHCSVCSVSSRAVPTDLDWLKPPPTSCNQYHYQVVPVPCFSHA